MELSARQLQQFDDEGWLFFPEVFSAEEVAVLRDEAETLYRTDRKEIWREKSGAPRPPSPRTPTTRRSACWARIRG